MLIRKEEWGVEVTIRTIVVLFILLIAFLWIPSIHSKISMNESFMAAFKSFFTTVFFDGVLFLGTVIIIGATNLLIFRINEDAYIHSANIIFLFVAPIYFLSMIPKYLFSETGMSVPHDSQSLDKDGEEHNHFDEQIRLTSPTKFLETLISYVVIPITAVFTIILLLYIIINITGEFWSDNLMEPMLVSYSVIVIVVYILASTIQKPIARYFRLIFPKVLIPVVLFQTVSSILKISDVGVTYGRYYVIMFGVFATVAGVIFSILPIRKNGMIAPILIVLSVISIIPPVDAFGISKANQSARLENALTRNNMLSGNTITPNQNIAEDDRVDIITSLDYLDRMNYTKDVDYLNSYYSSFDFEKTFGFTRYGYEERDYLSYYYSRNTNEPITVSGYDSMLQMSIYNMANVPDNSFEVDGAKYTLRIDNTDKANQMILIENSQGEEMLRYEYNNLFTKFSEGNSGNSGKALMSTEELTFRQDNDIAAIAIIVNNISVNEWAEGQDKSADLIILVDIK
jgi:hypothetical protein